jgi:hypothetical protein
LNLNKTTFLLVSLVCDYYSWSIFLMLLIAKSDKSWNFTQRVQNIFSYFTHRNSADYFTWNQWFLFSLWKSRICIVERIWISYFLALSCVAMFYATTEQKLIHSFWNALRIRRKINQLHQSLFYASSIYYTTQNNPWICRYRFKGKVFLIFLYHPSYT